MTFAMGVFYFASTMSVYISMSMNQTCGATRQDHDISITSLLVHRQHNNYFLWWTSNNRTPMLLSSYRNKIPIRSCDFARKKTRRTKISADLPDSAAPAKLHWVWMHSQGYQLPGWVDSTEYRVLPTIENSVPQLWLRWIYSSPQSAI